MRIKGKKLKQDLSFIESANKYNCNFCFDDYYTNYSCDEKNSWCSNACKQQAYLARTQKNLKEINNNNNNNLKTTTEMETDVNVKNLIENNDLKNKVSALNEKVDQHKEVLTNEQEQHKETKMAFKNAQKENDSLKKENDTLKVELEQEKIALEKLKVDMVKEQSDITTNQKEQDVLMDKIEKLQKLILENNNKPIEPVLITSPATSENLITKEAAIHAIINSESADIGRIHVSTLKKIIGIEPEKPLQIIGNTVLNTVPFNSMYYRIKEMKVSGM